MQLIDSEGMLFFREVINIHVYMHVWINELFSKSIVTLNYLRRNKRLLHHYLSKLLKHRKQTRRSQIYFIYLCKITCTRHSAINRHTKLVTCGRDLQDFPVLFINLKLFCIYILPVRFQFIYFIAYREWSKEKDLSGSWILF